MLKGRQLAAVEACHRILFQTLEEGFGLLFEQIGEDLFKASASASSNQQQMAFLDAVNVARGQEGEAWGQYRHMVDDTWQLFWRNGRLPGAPGSGEEASDELTLSLVEQDELEEELTAVTLISRTNDLCGRTLFGLNVRFAHLLGRKELENDENPAAPQLLTLTFRELVDQWPLEVPARVLVLKSFGKVVLARLKHCYEAMNLQLVEHDVLPKLDYSAFVRAGYGGGGGRRGAERSEAGGEAIHEPIEVPPMEEIWQNLQGLNQTVGAAAAGGGDVIQISRRELLDALSQIQPATAKGSLPGVEEGQPVTGETLREWLKQIIQAQKAGAEGSVGMGAAEQQVIDVILTLFEHLMEDPSLPDAMRALIGRLQIPVLKAAMVDDSFLHNEDHPARRLIDELARASMGWRDDGDRSEDSLYMQVKKAVDRIVHDYQEDIGLFEEVRAEFAAYMERQEKVRKALEQRLAQEISGRERLTVARQRVDHMLRQMIPPNLPRPALQVLAGPWRRLLTILLLQEGEEGRNWQRAVRIARLIVEYLSGQPRKETREERMARLSRLMGGVKRGFIYISLDRKKANELLDGLRSCFIDLLQEEDGPVSQPVEAPEAPATEMLSEFGEPPEHPSTFVSESESLSSVLQETEMVPEREPDEYDQRVAELQEGTWLKLEPEEGEGEPLVCKLVWRSHYTGTMVFVDGQGNKAAQLKEAELAERFREGRASLVEDAQTPLFDRALKRMIRALRREESGGRSEAGAPS